VHLLNGINPTMSMNNTDKIIIKNQLRMHHKPSLFGWFRRWYLLKHTYVQGKNILVDTNVKLLRFPKNILIGNDVILKEGVRICPTNPQAKISIGDNTTIGYHTMIFSSKHIEIGNDCLIAPFCYIVDSNHQIKKNININEQAIEAKNIVIQDDVWLGTGTKVLSGVTIEKGAVIAAGSLVNKNISANTIFGGVPATQIGERV